VGRAYAGILGSLAFFTTLAHGLLHSAGVGQTAWRASLALLTFAFVGCIAGQLAGSIVEEAVRSQLTSEIAKKAAETTATKRADPRSGNVPRPAGVKT
jgi:hypothetical protein